MEVFENGSHFFKVNDFVESLGTYIGENAIKMVVLFCEYYNCARSQSQWQSCFTVQQWRFPVLVIVEGIVS